jgi:putative spermidine/putrescine transport system permease protein
MKKLMHGLFAVAVLFPFGFLLVLSFGRQWLYPSVFPAGWTAEHWRLLLSASSDLARSGWLSLVISLSVAALSTGLGFFTARHLAYHRRREQLLRAAYLPYVFAPVLLAATLQYHFLWAGLAGRLSGVLLAQLFVAYPFGVIFFAGFWNERMRSMAQLSATLGGNGWQTFRRVLLPAARGALSVCFFQTFLISWYEYGLTTLIGIGKVRTLTVRVFQYIGEANLFHAALAGILLVLPPLLLLWVNKQLLFKTSRP